MPNGSSSAHGAPVLGNGVLKHAKTIARVYPPGTTLYDDSLIDREEFVRLVIQSLRDVGYLCVLPVRIPQPSHVLFCPPPLRESAATLEAESGYTMEAPEVSEFRQYILDADWSAAEAALVRLGVTEDEGLWVSSSPGRPQIRMGSDPPHPSLQQAKFLIGQQKFLELLEARKTIPALNVLRNELAPLNASPDQLHSLTKCVAVYDIGESQPSLILPP